MRVLTQQPQGKTTVDRTNKLGKNTTFLWSGANPADDSADSLFVGSGINPQTITTGTSNRGKVLATLSTGSISWRLYDPGTGYTVSSGLLRKNSVWSQGVVFKYRNATQAGANTEPIFNVTNSGSWNHRIFVDASGFVQVRNPSWTAGVFLTSDAALVEGDWVSVVVVWENGNSRFYVNGVLQTQTSALSIYTAGLERIYFSPVGIDILTAFVADEGWTGADALSWHNNHWQLFKTQTSTYEKLTSKLVFDVPQAITKSSYVQTAGMPRKPVPVNGAHPLSHGIKFASGPVWDKFDASNNTITYNTPTSISNAYGSEQNLYAYSKGVYTRYGLAFKSSVSRFSEHVATRSFNGVNTHTLLQVICLEADQYPVNFAGTGVCWGDANSFRLEINSRGSPSVRINANQGNPAYLTASLDVVPLRKLAVLVSVVEQGVGTTLYINGKVVGFTTTTQNSLGGEPRRILYSGEGVFSNAPSVYLSCGWHRALSLAEVQQMSENPWQIFQQPSKLRNKYAQAVIDVSRKFFLMF